MAAGFAMRGDLALEAAPDLAALIGLAAVPALAVPDFVVPDFAMPDFVVPDFAVPDVAGPVFALAAAADFDAA